MKERGMKLPFTEPCGNGLLRFNNWDRTQLSTTEGGKKKRKKERDRREESQRKGGKKGEKKEKQQPKSD